MRFNVSKVEANTYTYKKHTYCKTNRYIHRFTISIKNLLKIGIGLKNKLKEQFLSDDF